MKSISAAEKTAMTRAMEMTFPKSQRLYEDEISYLFLTRFNKMFIQMMKTERGRRWMLGISEKAGEGVYGGIISRTRYMDDILVDAVDDKFDAVVNLGGGFDSRCVRFDMGDIPYFHMDQLRATKDFMKMMKKLPSGTPSNVRFVPIDFDRQNIAEVLMNAGFDRSMRTLFLWEGVTQYISEDAMSGTLDYIASTAKGSKVVFTYVLKALLDNPSSFPKYERIVKQVKTIGYEWVTGIDPDNIADLLEKHGLTLIEDVGAKEHQERYFKPIGREMTVMPIERIALAKV